MQPKALVLLGKRNSGKSTIANHLVTFYAGTAALKFGALSKSMVSEMLNVDASYLESKEWRTSSVSYTHLTLPTID
jgi:hypothetical protein